MGHGFYDIAFTPSVKAAQVANGSRDMYAESEASGTHVQLGEAEAEFIAARDSFYMASVTETGWPYVQHRGGPTGFLKALDANRIAFADFRGNRQFITKGNLDSDDRVSLFVMDYPNRRRLKILGRAKIIEKSDDPDLIAKLQTPSYRGLPERAMVITVEGFDWNCPQHITPRFTQAEVQEAVAPLQARIAELEEALAFHQGGQPDKT